MLLRRLLPLLVLLFARDGTSRLGIVGGLVLTLAATHGVLDALGTYDDSDDARVGSRVTLGALMPHLAALLASLLVGLFAVSLASVAVLLVSELGQRKRWSL